MLKLFSHEQSRTDRNQLNKLTLNVYRLVSKLSSPEFNLLIQQYDVIGLAETKTDGTDSYLEIPGYKIFFHNRSCISSILGGILPLVKHNYVHI